MFISDNTNYSLLALLVLTALIVGKSVDGHPGGGSQEGAGDEWAEDAIVNGCNCHTGEQLNEGMYNIGGVPNSYVPEATYEIALSVNDSNVERLSLIHISEPTRPY